MIKLLALLAVLIAAAGVAALGGGRPAPPNPPGSTPVPRKVTPTGDLEPKAPDKGSEATKQWAVQRARAALAKRLDIGEDAIELVTITRKYGKKDRSDMPGVPDGWVVRLEAEGKLYSYHVTPKGFARPLNVRT